MHVKNIVEKRIERKRSKHNSTWLSDSFKGGECFLGEYRCKFMDDERMRARFATDTI